MPVNPNLVTTPNNYSFGPSGEQYFNVPGYGIFGPTQVQRGMLPADFSTSQLTRNLSPSQIARLLAVPQQQSVAPYTPTVAPQAPTPPMGGGVPAQPNPTPSGPPIDWPSLITQWINQLTANKTPDAPQPVNVTPGPGLPPQTLTQSPTPPGAPATMTDIPTGGDTSATQKSKLTPDVTVPFDDTAGTAPPAAPSPVQDLSQFAKMPGLFTGGPLVMPIDTSGLTSQNQNPGKVTVPFDDTANGLTGGISGSGGYSPSPVTVSPAQTLGGIFGGGGDFGTGSSAKTGSSGGLNTNDAINTAIGVGGMLAPPGIGAALGVGKGLADLGIYGGDTYNTNGLTAAQSLLYGPTMGERLVNGVQGLFGNGGMPITAANDPNAQIGNQSVNGGLTAGLFSGGPATAPAGMFDPSLIAGNSFGSGAMSGGWMSPSLNFSMDQLGGMLDLSGLSDFMSGAKMPMGGM
jgi:hypothetical protein